MSGSFRPQGPRISFSSIIIHYRCQWSEMLTRPKTSNVHTYCIFFPKLEKKNSIPIFFSFFEKQFFIFNFILINIVKVHIKLNLMKFPLKWGVKQLCRVIEFELLKIRNKEKWKGWQSGTYLRQMRASSGPQVSVAKIYRDETKWKCILLLRKATVIWPKVYIFVLFHLCMS